MSEHGLEKLIGRTIRAIEPDIEKPPPGLGGEPALEGVTLWLDNGAIVGLYAMGWHDIQSLIVDWKTATPHPEGPS